MLLKEKEEIEAWLKKYQIQNYILIEDEKYGYVVNAFSGVKLKNVNLESIDVKFDVVNGFFDCSFNQIETLEGCPNKVLGDFYCNNNQLKTLKGGPNKVIGDFACSKNLLKTLKYSPKEVSGHFWCNNNYLKTIKGCPEIINGYFCCYDNELEITGLKYLPELVESNFIEISINSGLNKLQEIYSFKDLKEKVNEFFKIKEEKENLLNSINEESLNKNKNTNKI